MLDPNYWPAVFYGPDGQNQIFQRPTEVPEGWHDNPAKVGDPDAVTVIPGLDEALAGEGSEVEEDEEGDDEELEAIPAYEDITAAEIKALLDKHGVTYGATDSKTQLYNLLNGNGSAA